MTIESALMICQKKINELEKLRIIDDWSYQESGGNPELEFLKFVESIIKSFIKIDLDKLSKELGVPVVRNNCA